MSLFNLLLALGILFVILGLVLFVVWNVPDMRSQLSGRKTAEGVQALKNQNKQSEAVFALASSGFLRPRIYDEPKPEEKVVEEAAEVEEEVAPSHVVTEGPVEVETVEEPVEVETVLDEAIEEPSEVEVDTVLEETVEEPVEVETVLEETVEEPVELTENRTQFLLPTSEVSNSSPEGIAEDRTHFLTLEEELVEVDPEEVQVLPSEVEEETAEKTVEEDTHTTEDRTHFLTEEKELSDPFVLPLPKTEEVPSKALFKDPFANKEGTDTFSDLFIETVQLTDKSFAPAKDTTSHKEVDDHFEADSEEVTGLLVSPEDTTLVTSTVPNIGTSEKAEIEERLRKSRENRQRTQEAGFDLFNALYHDRLKTNKTDF